MNRPSTSNAVENEADRVQEFIRLQNPRPKILRATNDYVDVINSAVGQINDVAGLPRGNGLDARGDNNFNARSYNFDARSNNFDARGAHVDAQRLPRVHTRFTRGTENRSSINTNTNSGEICRTVGRTKQNENSTGTKINSNNNKTSNNTKSNRHCTTTKIAAPDDTTHKIVLTQLIALKSSHVSPRRATEPSVNSHRLDFNNHHNHNQQIVTSQPKKDSNYGHTWSNNEISTRFGGAQKSSQTPTTTAATSIMCPQCGKCRCADCAKPRQLPSTYVCNHSFLCSADSLVDCASCACCVKGCFYHAGLARDSDEDDYGPGSGSADSSSNFRGSGSSGSRSRDQRRIRFLKKWACLGLACLTLPCFWCYLPLKGCAKCCECAYARLHDNGCRCSRRRSRSAGATAAVDDPNIARNNRTGVNNGGRTRSSRSRTPSRSRYEHLERRLLIKSNSSDGFSTPFSSVNDMQISPLIDTRTVEKCKLASTKSNPVHSSTHQNNKNYPHHHSSTLTGVRSDPFTLTGVHMDNDKNKTISSQKMLINRPP